MNKLLLLIFFIATNVFAQEGDEDLKAVFADSQVEGTVVIENLDGSKRYVYNQSRAHTKLAVASTFKIPNTLIGVDEHLVTGKSSVFEWDGKEHDIKAWNQNQTLASAFQVSCVWCYQDIAKKVGAEKYKAYIKAMHYGALPDQFDVQTFWLDGTLKLTAYEQVNFLKRLYHHELTFSDNAFHVLKDIMLAEKTENYSMYAKSGWARRVESPVGWYVGYVESRSGVWFFATNLAVKDAKHLSLRKAMTVRALRHVGAI
ncbi:Beta-lactamase OXA-2 precursor [Marinomonas spartinae]|uniref:Beta-lactamase OXA-2 n=1 Tax=Marinomonas spartinae TaxID=1792290 RepID=A0A1A8TTG2_9GAMM|nr:class D beta-lactamase [Marinomonas spartinae]SBS37736.1 Beta-lactamase OXA-2 precursor [Marinomonas spartinae]